MIVLGFDTSTPASAIGLRLPDGATLHARDDPARGERPGHATRLLPLAAGLLAQAGLRFADVDRIAVGVGPGTFTGLRIGVASARGLAQALQADLVGVSSPQALAVAAASGEAVAPRGVLAVIDARRGEAFAAAYTAGDEPTVEHDSPVPRELVPPRALAPAEFGEILEAVKANGDSVMGWVAVGSGAMLYRDALHALGISVPADDSPLHRVNGEAICALAASGVAQAIDTVLPDYRRRPDAELALEHAAASGGADT
ncbi:MAG TPA: tRNA (adenosine(37)-N6)-threonylcarbamoyltransferase complex dimerization subunit type 1 TsaB [Solirubrobacteraceae bacterium]|jgi:tRNA threonylcarbamoyladenosine biosynthesis protein TsaB|nr:tRNA (adenosine(37)-N6)-threonylcarbamoyltransferase complex dimerization subunit type 1 TsaB [Solirubrobacteraceae bacterium]